MAFDISRLTNAVNKYLNSISDVGKEAAQQAQEIADRAQFQADLADAIKQNIESRTRDVDEVPDIGAMVQSQVQSATAGIDSTFQQINGAFLEISEAGKGTSSAKDSVDTVQGADKTGSSSSGTGANFDAYAGTLSTDALKELSNSGYFSGNLIADSLFKTDDEEDSSSSGALNSVTSALTATLGQTQSTTVDPFKTQSLDQLNVNSLLANSLGVGTTASKQSTGDSAGQASLTTDQASLGTGGDLAKAIIKAYTESAKASANTSIFGDFSL